MERMHIAVASRAVAPLHGWGGLERAVGDVCTALTERGHHVTLFTAASDTMPAQESLVGVTELVSVPWSAGVTLRRGSVLDRVINYPRFIRRLTAAVATHGTRFDAAIGHGAAAAAFVPLLPTGQVGRLLVNPHGMEEFTARGLKRPLLAGQRSLVRRAARHADAVIALDPHLVRDVLRNLGIPRERVAIVSNGIDVARIDTFTGPTAPIAGTGPVIVSVARIEPNKGLDVLAAALGANRERLPAGWRWLHIGDGSARAAVQQAIERAGIAAHAELRGTIPDEELHRLLANATLFVHPTRYEGSPLAILEAMTHRLPVVASAVGGIPDTVIPGETGWLVPPDDAAALGEAIVDALDRPDTVLRMIGEAARARIVERYSLDHVVDELLALLDTPSPPMPGQGNRRSGRERVDRNTTVS
jgi:glycogen(starch) synthase